GNISMSHTYNFLPMGKKDGISFYGVANGRKTGVFHTWKECEAQVSKFPCARFKGFKTEKEAADYVEELKPRYAASSSSGSSEAESSSGNASKRRSKQDSKEKDDEETPTKKRKLSDSADETPKPEVNEEGFMVDSLGYVIVFTDGACSHNGRNGSKAGIGVWFGDQHDLNVSEPVEGRQTNNTAEIQAAEKAVLQAKKAGISKLNVQTDSKFVINCITDWMKKWKKNGWKLKTGQEVINRADLEKLDEATTGMDMKWTYVAGHKGNAGNEAADRLAVQGASKSKCP
ncbi:unnamed protein product, partial [Allacma fusca]